MTATSTHPKTSSLLEKRVRDAIDRVNREGSKGLESIEDLVDPYVVFQDPLKTVYGREEFIQTHQKLLSRSKDFFASIASFVESDDHVFATWTMSFTPRFGPRITIEGCTYAQLRDGTVTYQRDYWDLLGSFMETLPAVGLLYRRVTRMLG